jgi:hypothetical protein
VWKNSPRKINPEAKKSNADIADLSFLFDRLFFVGIGRNGLGAGQKQSEE